MHTIVNAGIDGAFDLVLSIPLISSHASQPSSKGVMETEFDEKTDHQNVRCAALT